MNTTNLAVIRAKLDALPALPATVNRVMSITSDPESSANDLMQAILPDQTMCATILKVANSALFGQPRQISSVERAVVVLGQDEVRNIVIGKAVFTSFPRLEKDYRHTVDLFWEHAFTCGLAAKIIGEHIHLPPGEAFIAGLIHDIGKLVMLMAFPNEYPVFRELSIPESFCMTAEEAAGFSLSHEVVGMQLATKWMLPEQLVMAIGYHHSPQSAPNFSPYPLIVQVADILSLMYSNPDMLNATDIIRIFEDFLPETADLWKEKHLGWNASIIGQWFDALKEQRDSDQGILDMFTS